MMASNDVEYQALPGATEQEQQRTQQMARQWSLRRTVTGAIAALAVCGAVVAVVASNNNAAPAPPAPQPEFFGGPWSIPRAYQVRVVMRLPYSGLVEDAMVYSDKDQDAQRIVFYPGKDYESVHLFNSSGSGYQIIPILTEKQCFEDKPRAGARGVAPQDIFPKHFHNLFAEEPSDETVVVNGVACKVFKYVNEDKTGDEDGYLGTYRFYLDAEKLRPVQLHFLGHNIFMGGSHFDEYVLDYSEFQDLTEQGGVDPAIFRVPEGMQCTDIMGHTSEETASEEEQNQRRVADLQHPPADHAMLLPHNDELRTASFKDHAEAHGLSFASPEEERFRQRVFHSNRRHVNARNRQGEGYTLGLNHLAHKTDAELKELRGTSPNQQERLCRTETLADIQAQRGNVTLPRVVDYVNGTHKLVLPPGDQGSCGSCWTFGATGALEAAVAKATGKLVSLSKQNILDCALGVPYLNHGCGGGGDFKAYEWVINNNGGKIATAESYPYLNQPGVCHFDETRGLLSNDVQAAPALIKDCVVVTERYLNNSWVTNDQSVDAFLYKLATQGPLAISINATPKDFYFYKSGVYSSSECAGDINNLDHAVLAVAYNLDEGYMVLRNSWSDHWGEGGYARVSLKGNTCGFATMPTYAVAE